MAIPNHRWMADPDGPNGDPTKPVLLTAPTMTAPTMTQGALSSLPQGALSAPFDAGFLTQGYAPQLDPVSVNVLTEAMAPEVAAPMIDAAPPPAPVLSQAARGTSSCFITGRAHRKCQRQQQAPVNAGSIQ